MPSPQPIIHATTEVKRVQVHFHHISDPSWMLQIAKAIGTHAAEGVRWSN